MNDIITIAQTTFYRVARMPALYVILLICIFDVAAMALYKDISINMEQELMFDCAQAMTLVVALITSMVAAFEIPRELREKTAQFILSKPMGRSAFIWGKFFGVGSLVVFNCAIILVGSLAAYRLSFGETPWLILLSGALIIAEGLVLTGLGLVLSIFLTDTLAAICQFAFFAVGHSIYMLPRLEGLGNPLTRGLTYIFPNFHHLDIKTELPYGDWSEAPSLFVGLGVAYGIAYALFAVGLAAILFSRKDIQ